MRKISYIVISIVFSFLFIILYFSLDNERVYNTKDLVGGFFISQDGQADPIGVTNVLAKSAKNNGAQFFEKCPVKKILLNQLRYFL